MAPEQSAFMTWIYQYANVIQFFAQLAFYVVIAIAAVGATWAWSKYAKVARKALYLQYPALLPVETVKAEIKAEVKKEVDAVKKAATQKDDK